MPRAWTPLMLLLALIGCGGPPGPSASSTAMAALARRTLVVPTTGMVLSYLQAGDPAGRRVIFVHGTPGESRGWADFLLGVPPGYDYVAVDRPGFGASGPDGAVVSLGAQAAALAPLLETRGGRPPILVGHSLGGPIVARVAVDYPARLGGLVIAAGSLDPGLEQVHWAQPIGEWRPVRSMLPRSLRNANRELMALQPELQALAPRLAGIRCHVEIVHGTDDGLVPYANVVFLRETLRAAPIEVTTLAGADHFLPWKHADAITAAIERVAGAGDDAC